MKTLTDEQSERRYHFCQGYAAMWRKSIWWFAGEMESKLRQNEWKGGWSKCSQAYLLTSLHEELQELQNAERPENIIQEATDVANFAMMIADNARALLDATKDAI